MQLAPRQLDLFGRLSRAPVSTPAPPGPRLDVVPIALPQVAERPPTRQETLARARALAAQIAQLLGPDLKVLLTVHDNRSTMISFRRQPPLLKIRAHHMFLDAPQAVVRSIADYAGRGKTSAGVEIDDYIAAQQKRIRAMPTKPALLESRGECFDLHELYVHINEAHFGNGVSARIGWGRNTSKRRRKSIRLGVYDHKAREIRIHPALDRPDVPRFFVEFIVFHEMLHQLFPSDRDTGRHVHHPRAFRERERAFPKYAAAMAWERQHLQELLRR
ncbi:MAG: hypothetical protein Q8L48_26615 [Archangium sp.]|nr:hypothetical protein [Archangium sp.]